MEDVKFHLKYEQNSDMLLDLSKNFMKTSPFRKYLVWILLFAAVMFLISMLSQTEGDLMSQLMSYIFPVALMLGLWYFLFRFILKKQIKKQQDSSKSLTGWRELIITEKEFYLNSPSSNTTYQWDILHKFQESVENYFLYIAANQAIVVPKIAFKSREEEQAFVSFIEGKVPQ